MTDTTVVPAVPPGVSEESGLSRRRMLTGAAWATPAVLIATAAPAIAASSDPQGVIEFNGSYITNEDAVRYLLNLAVFHAGPWNADDLSEVTVSIVIPAAKVSGPATVDAPLWTVTGPVVSGANLIYSGIYSGTVAKYVASSPLVLKWDLGTSPYTLTAQIAASARSGGATVSGTTTLTGTS